MNVSDNHPDVTISVNGLNYKIMVIDDDEGLNLLIRKKLIAEGFQVDWAENGNEALSKIKGEENEVLFVDYKLPDMTGKELIEKLEEKFQKIPHFIAMTGFGDEIIAVEMMKLGAKDYIIKDSNFIDLLPGKIKQICGAIDKTRKLGEAQESIRKQNELLWETGEMARVGGWEVDLDKNTVYWTQGTKKIHEVPQDYIPSLKEAVRFFPGDSLTQIENAIEHAINEGEAYDLELPFKTAKGRDLWVHTIGKPEMKDGRCIRLHGTIQDITRHKKAEEQLKALNQQLIANEQHLRATNQKLVANEQQLRAALQQLQANEQQLKAANQQLQAGEQQLRAANQHLVASENELREANKGLLEAKQKAEESEKALKHSHYLMKYVIEHNRSAVAVHDKNFKYIYVSQKYLQEYKVKENDIIGKHHYDVFPDLPQKWRDIHKKALLGEVSSAEDDPYYKDDGTVEWTRWECRPWYENDNSIGGFIVYTEVITQRKKMEMALKAAKEKAEESEEKYKALYVNAPLSYQSLNEDGSFKDVNPTWLSSLGYKREEVIGRYFKEFLHPDWESHFEKNFPAFKTRGYVSNVQFKIRHKKGHYLDISFEGCIGYNPDGSFKQTYCVFQDITELKKNEVELQKAKQKAEESEERLFLANEELKMHNNELEALTRILKNDFSSQKEMLDYTLLQAINLTDSKIGYLYFYNEEKKEFVLNSWSGEVMKECKVTDPTTIYQLDSTGCWGEAVRQRKPFFINDNSLPNKYKKGTPEGHVQLKKFLTLPIIVDYEIKAVIGVANKSNNYNDKDIKQLTLLMDAVWKIVEQNQHHVAILKAKEEVEKNEFELKEAQKISNVGSWQYDVRTQKHVWSEEMLRIWGLQNQEQVQNYQQLNKYIHPEDWDKFDTAVNNAIDKGLAYNIELRIIRPNGEERTIIAIGEPVFDSKGRITSLRGTNQDITERKRIENELIASKEKAEEADRLKSAFLANMSHEIRTPMNGILGFSSLLNEPGLSGEEQQMYIDIIQQSGKRMLDTINDLIDISKIETGQVEISTQEINISEEVESLYRFFAEEANKKGLELELKNLLSDHEKSFKTDQRKFHSILTNLIKNAVKYTDKGSIEIGVERKDNLLSCYVKDTGIGIPQFKQQSIFQRFVQADIADTRAFQGSGLGLSITKAYIDMLGGSIQLESEVDVGTIFHFTLPDNQESNC